jgi:hypothetical protein
MTVRPPWRWLTALLLLVNAGVHIPLVPEHLDEAPYIGVLFILLSVACIVLAVVIVVVDTTWVWAASGTISLLALVTFVLSRTVGLPQIGDDVGNWTDPLGFPALASEALTVALAAGALRRRAAAPACA